MSDLVIPSLPSPRPAARGDGAVGNFFAPFFDVSFYQAAKPTGERTTTQGSRETTTTGEIGEGRVLLRSVSGEIVGVSDPQLEDIRNFRSSLTIEGVSAAAYRATLTLTPPYLDGIDLIDRRLIKFGAIMEIQWGYLNIGGGEPIISDKGLFTITQPSIRFGREIQVQISGYDMFSTSAKSLEARCVWDRAAYKTDLDILRKLADRILGSADKLDVSALPPEAKVFKEKRGETVQTDSNWIFFRRLCNANGLGFQPVGSKLKLYEMVKSDLRKPSYRLVWWAQPQTDRDIPMMTFETNPIMGYFAQEGSRGIHSYTTDLDTKKTIEREHKPEETPTPGAPRSDAQEDGFAKDALQLSEGVVKPFSEADNACESGKIIATPSQRPNEEDEVEEEARHIARNANTKAAASCPGVPSLLPLMIVEIAGVGRTFSGNYRVMKVVHNIGAGYTMNLDLLRAASTGDLRDDTPKTDAPGGIESLEASKPGTEVVEPTSQAEGRPLRRVS